RQLRWSQTPRQTTAAKHANSAPDAPAPSKQPAPPAAPPTQQAPAQSAGGVTEVKVPDIGDFKDIPVIEILVKPGDHVEKEAPLITLESDKATMEVPAPAAGVVKEVKVKVGDKVSEGALIVLLESAAGAPASAPAQPSGPAAAP